MNRLRRDPAWREMFTRLDANAEADRRAEAEQQWAEMAGHVRRWRRHADDPHAIDRVLRQARKYTEVLHVAVAIIAERDREIANITTTNLHLRAQLRALMSGRTVAAERQAIDAEDRGDGERRAA